MKRLYLLGVLLVLFITRHYWAHAGVPYTHDGENHLARFANYKVAIREFQIPPRFAPNLLNHYGYPVFNYNYPLANILSVPFSILKIPYETTLTLLVILSLFFGTMGVIRWLRFYTDKQSTLTFAITAFLFAPPLITNLLYRGSVGELLAYALLPWLLYSTHLFTEKLSRKRIVAIAILFACFLLSHNIGVVVLTPLIGMYSLAQLKHQKKIKRWLQQVAVLGLISLGLSLWFWLPAIVELNQVIVTRSANQNAFAEHFPTVSQLLYSPLRFGFSYPGPVDTLSFWLGFLIPANILAGIYLLSSQARPFEYLLKLTKKYSNRHSVGILLLISIGLVFFQLSISEPVWRWIPSMRLIQFPWRLGLYLTVFMLPLLAVLFQSSGRLVKKIFWIALILQMVVILMAIPANWVSKENQQYDLHGGTTSTQNENLPESFKYLLIGDWQASPSVSQGEADVTSVELWNGSRRRYRLNAYSDSVITEPTMRFLGWQTMIRSIDGDSFVAVEYIDSDEIQGRIAYLVTPGFYEVKTEFTQWTWARVVGNSLFIATLCAGCGVLIFQRYAINKKNS